MSPLIDTWELLIRLLGAAALGGLIGVEREFSDQPAGFRTHLLVSLGAALFTLAGAYGLQDFSGRDGFTNDPTRVAAQVVTGIGFLGAGAIIQRGISIRGLTTAASLWVTAAIGLAMGFGYWEGAVGATALALLALFGLKYIGRRVFPLIRAPRLQLVLETGPEFRLSDFERVVAQSSVEIHSMRIQATGSGAHRISAGLEIGSEVSPNSLAENLSDLTGVHNVDWRA